MQTIRKRLSVLFVVCSLSAILLITLFVNVTVNNKFNSYLIDIQNKRYERIVNYFREVYVRDGKWSDQSGVELMHEAYMGNYYLTLEDDNEKTVWGMDPEDVRYAMMHKHMNNNKGIYSSKRFEIQADGRIAGYITIGQYSSVLLSKEDMDFKAAINKSIIISGMLALFIVVLISLYFSRQFSAPVKHLARMSKELSRGNFKMKISRNSNIEELENLRLSMNILSEKLNHQDILRKRLVSDISHEIRTPLNVLQNNLEAMIDEIFEVTPERLVYLNEEVIRFGRLIDNLDTLKGFESESIMPDYEDLALDELIGDIYTDYCRAFQNKSIELLYRIEPSQDYHIKADRNRLKQVFINLLSNSLKFTGSNGHVSIDLSAGSKEITVKINDDGLGIRKEDLPFIFERLYRADKSRGEDQGNGIGLTIVKNILELHDAKIEVESEEGRGSVFTLVFNK